MVRLIHCPDGRIILEADDAEVALRALKQGIAQLHITEAIRDDLPGNVTPTVESAW